MPVFPRAEPEIASLALFMVQGLREAPADFPAPPVSADDLQVKLDAFQTQAVATVAAENAVRERHAAKDAALADLVNAMKADLKYGEAAVRTEPAKLSKLGWGPRRDSASLQAPGEVRDMRIVSEGDTWVMLSWNPPVNGGAVSAYRIQRRRENGPWEEAGVSTGTEQLLNNQARGVELSFRVIALNRVGQGAPSATVTVVL